MSRIDSIAQLEALYGLPNAASTVKEIHYVSEDYAAFIAASPFLTIATSGPEGLDCSPRGDRPGFVRIADEKTLMIPDRRGNNRVDTLRNIIADPRVGLLFLIPGSGTTLRVNGTAHLSVDPELLASFAVDGKAPRSVIVLTITTVFFQCARAIVRSALWDPDEQVDPASLPTPGSILARLSKDTVGGAEYDRAWPERAQKTLW